MRFYLGIFLAVFAVGQAKLVEWTEWHGALLDSERLILDKEPTEADSKEPVVNKRIHKQIQYFLAKKGWTMRAPGHNTFTNEADVIIFHNTGRNITVEDLKASPAKKILIQWEPPVVFPHLFEKEYEACFDKIITWRKTKADGKKYILFSHPSLMPLQDDLPKFSGRRLVCMINGNKHSAHVNRNGILYTKHPDELYSERRAIIEFYERCSDLSFDLYGWDWERENYRNYMFAPAGDAERTRGKFEVLKKYKFSYVLENYRNDEGYISEKILNCFAVGTVPIYLGYSKITDIIPANCFIDMRDFKNYREIHEFINSMDEKTWLEYRRNAEKFLKSEAAQEFTHQKVVDAILKAFDGLELE